MREMGITWGSLAIQTLAEGRLCLSGAQLAGHGIPLPALPPESAIVIGIRRAT